jgi:KR domain/Phosphopantetheine attachment site
MTSESFRGVLKPKVDGTINVDRLLPRNQLDFFIMLSSCAGIVGNHGQGNYAAGSAFQDAFARNRTNAGFPTWSLDLGMIESAGYVSENADSVRFLSDQGYIPIKLTEFFALINHAVTTPATTTDGSQSIIGLQHTTYESVSEVPTTFLDAKFRHLISKGLAVVGRKVDTGSIDLQEALSTATTQHGACEVVKDAIIAKVSKVLAMNPEEIEPSQAISNYGADSLVAVELRNWFVRQLEANVQIFEILSTTPISQLSNTVASRSKLVNSALFPVSG